MSKLEKVTAEFLSLFQHIHDQYFKPAEQITRSRLSPSQFHTLAILSRKGALPMSELAAELKISKQQLTPLIAKLIENGQVIRRADEYDRRIVRIEIAGPGRETFAAIKAEIKRSFTEKLSLIPETELAELEKMIARMQEILHQSKPDADPAAKDKSQYL